MRQKKISSMVLLLLCLCITALHAQQSANAAGGDGSGGGGSFSYSVGQVAYTYIYAATAFSGQGVQQPYEIYADTGVGIIEAAIHLSVTVFPNPTQSVVRLKIDAPTLDNLSFQLCDAIGQVLINQKINESLTEVPMQGLAPAAYVLRVSDRLKAVRTFTIIKNN
jgi:hypothetical protein